MECLSQSKEVLQGRKNLTYFAPTSGGKSIIAELLLFRALLGLKRRAMYVLPFVSIVTEKLGYISRLCENMNVKVVALHSQSEQVWSPSVDIVICTIEKANSLINRVIEERAYFDISYFIIDEFHLVSPHFLCHYRSKMSSAATSWSLCWPRSERLRNSSTSQTTTRSCRCRPPSQDSTS